MINKVFFISGNKISSLIADEESLKFSSDTYNTVETFKEAFNKKLSLATKVKIKYDSIRSIKKEDNEKNVWIKYKTYAGFRSDCVFSFNSPADYEVFFIFFEKERYFSRTHETLTPFKAIRNYLIGLMATIGFTIFMYYQAIEIKNGTVEETHSANTKVFNYAVGLLGDKGVIAAGALTSCYLLYKTWKRFSNPPNQVKLLPPNT
jgi:hypothetical protein